MQAGNDNPGQFPIVNHGFPKVCYLTKSTSRFGAVTSRFPLSADLNVKRRAGYQQPHKQWLPFAEGSGSVSCFLQGPYSMGIGGLLAGDPTEPYLARGLSGTPRIGGIVAGANDCDKILIRQ